MHHDIMGAFSGLPFQRLASTVHGAVMFKPDHSTRIVLARTNLPSKSKGAAVSGYSRDSGTHSRVHRHPRAGVGGYWECRSRSDSARPAFQAQPSAQARAGPEPLNGGVDDLVASEPIVQHNDP